MSAIVNLTCCCCGNGTRGRQWWNRDDGYGLCVDCGRDWILKMGVEETESLAGKRHVHWDVQEESHEG